MMKYLLLFLVLFPMFAYADVQVGGAGYAPVNQCYVNEGGGLWTSQDGDYSICTYDNGGGDDYAILNLSTDVCGEGVNEYYFHFGSPFSEMALAGSAGSWTAVTSWSAPGPVTITQTTCTGGGGGGGGGGSTTFAGPFDQNQELLFLAGIFIFLFSYPFWEKVLQIIPEADTL